MYAYAEIYVYYLAEPRDIDNLMPLYNYIVIAFPNFAILLQSTLNQVQGIEKNSNNEIMN